MVSCKLCGAQRQMRSDAGGIVARGAYNWYKKVRIKYQKIRRQAQVKHEKDIIDRCEPQPKLFYSYVKSKIKVTAIQMKRTYVKILIEFQSVFTKNYFNTREKGCTGIHKLENIDINKEMIEELKIMDKSRASGLDVICWVLKQCAGELMVHYR